MNILSKTYSNCEQIHSLVLQKNCEEKFPQNEDNSRTTGTDPQKNCICTTSDVSLELRHVLKTSIAQFQRSSVHLARREIK